MSAPKNPEVDRHPDAEVAARCHEMQTGLGLIEVPEFDTIRSIGMAVRLALHLQGLPAIKYETLRLVANHLLDIPAVGIRNIIGILAEVEFVKLQTEGQSIKTVLPNVPYYDDLYDTLGVYSKDLGYNEAEQLSLAILCRLSKAPEKVDSLTSKLGADSELVNRALEVGKAGAYFRVHRARGRDVALTPNYFAENAEIYADAVAATGSTQVRRILEAVRSLQGVPLSLVQQRKEIAGICLSDEELNLIIRLAQDGAVKPPSITSKHAGEQFFLFTPTPSGAALSPTKRDIYERSMAIVAAVRQGQFLSAQYPIKSPGALLYRLKQNMKLSKATTEASHQYRELVHLRIARLAPVGFGFYELRIIDTPENREALSIALELVDSGVATGTEVDEKARTALQQEHAYVESLVASQQLTSRLKVPLTSQQQLEIEDLLLK